MNPLDIVSSVLQISDRISKKADSIQANKKQFQRLVSRIQLLVQPLKKLKSEKKAEELREGITKLEQCLKECNQFMEDFNTHWVKRVVFSGTYLEKFNELNAELINIASLLQFSMVVNQLRNPEQDKQDQDEDCKAIIKNKDKIMQLQLESQRQLKDVLLNQKEQEVVLNEMKQWFQHHFTPSVLQSKRPLPSHLSISYSGLTFMEVLKEGEFGTIYRGEWNTETVIIKRLRHIDDHSRKNFEREVEILSRLHNPHIVQFYGACLDEGLECVVIEYMAKGSLVELLNQQDKRLSAQDKLKIAGEVIKGLHYLHENKMLHRDLRSGNVLINQDGHAKLTDFHTAEASTQSLLSAYGPNQETSASVDTTAPEMLEKGEYTESSEIYSYGVMLWEMFVGGNATAILPQQKQKLSSKEKFYIPAALNSHIATLIKDCLQSEPRKRPDAKEMMKRLEAEDKKVDSIDKNQAASASSSRQAEKKPETIIPEENPMQLCKEGGAAEQQGDFETAYRCYEKASHQSDARGLCNLAMLILLGRTKNPEDTIDRGLELLEGSANKDFPRAQYNLGMAYETGKWVKQDYTQAEWWLQKAANNNYADAIKKLETDPHYKRFKGAYNLQSTFFDEDVAIRKPPASSVNASGRRSPSHSTDNRLIARDSPIRTRNVSQEDSKEKARAAERSPRRSEDKESNSQRLAVKSSLKVLQA